MDLVTDRTEYKLFKNWVIPAEYLEDYAGVIAYSKQYSGTIPGPTKAYFIDRLTQLGSQPYPDGHGTTNIAALRDGCMIGWGHLSWSGTPEAFTWGELFVYLRPEHRRQGIGTEMCRRLLEQVSLEALWDCALEIPTFAKGGQPFVDQVLKAEQVDAQERKICLVRDWPLEQVSAELERLSGQLAQHGLEVRFCRGLDLAGTAELEDFIQLAKPELTQGEDLQTVIEGYLAGMRRWQDRGAEYWFYLAVDPATGKLVGFTRSGIKLEGALGLAHDDQTELAAGYRQADFAKALKLHVLHRLLSESDVTHWNSYTPGDKPYLVEADEALGFKYFTTHYTYHLDRAQAEGFKHQERNLQPHVRG